MFRRTLIASFAVITLGLFATFVYALLGLSGPQTTVDDAQAAYDNAEYTHAVRLLDRAEGALGPSSNPELRARILDLRHRAHLQVDNLPRALEDLNALARLGDTNAQALKVLGIEQEDLAINRIYHTLRTGDGQLALEHAQEFLYTHENHPRALELAGEATYAAFAALYEELQDELTTRFDTNLARQAEDAIKVWLYRDETDPLATRKLQEFRDLVERYNAGAPLDGEFQVRLEELRRKIRRAQRYCRAAIVAPGGEPVAAYRLLRTSLEKGQRWDDIQILAETYLRRFDHVFCVDAAADLAELHNARGRHAAAIEAVDRFLPPGAWRTRCEEGKLSPEVARLWAAKARALLARGDEAGSQRLAEEVEEVQASGMLDLEPDLHLIRALTHRLSRPSAAMQDIAAFKDALETLPLTPAVTDKLFEAAEFQLAVGRELNYPNRFRIWINRRSARFRPDRVEPHINLARIFLEESIMPAAFNAAEEAYRIDGHNDEVLRIRTEIADRLESNAGRGSIERLDDFLRAGDVPSYIVNPLLWPQIAELAFRGKHYEIAYDCATNASKQYNWARWPRILQAESALLLGKPGLAAQAATSLLAFYPNDSDGLDLLARARQARGESISDLLFGSLLVHREDPSVARALLQQASDREDYKLADAIVETMETTYVDDAESQLMAAEYHLARGQNGSARKASNRAFALVTSPLDPLFAKSRATALLISALSLNEETVDRLRQETTQMLYGRADELYRYAQALAKLADQKPEKSDLLYGLAYDLVKSVLTDETYRRSRNGSHYEFGGLLALRLHRFETARRHLVAALAFEDSGHASRLLTLLRLRQGERFDTSETFWESRATDLTSACLLAREARQISSLHWAESTLAITPLDLPAMCLRAYLDREGSQPVELERLVELAPNSLLDTLTFLEAAGFEDVAVTQSEALLKQFPQNRFCKFLTARARINAGDVETAVRILGDLMKETNEDRFLWAHEETARLLERKQVSGAEVVNEIIQPIAESDPLIGAAPTMRDVALRKFVSDLFKDASRRDNALTILTQRWKERPRGVSMEDVDFLATNGRPDLALDLLNTIERTLPESKRSTAIETFFTLVTRLAKQGSRPQLVEDARQRARRIIRTEGAFGAAVHFLLEHPDSRRTASEENTSDPEDAVGAMRDLRAHFEMFVRNRDRDPARLLRSLELYSAYVSTEALIEQADLLLQHEPSLPDLWLLRAKWLTENGRENDALESLLWIEHYLPKHPARIKIAELTARTGKPQPDAEGVLRTQLGADVLSRPEAAFARGLMDLRAARYTASARAFDSALPQSDGAHLYFDAICELTLDHPDQARDLLQQLAEHYPNSPLSENAAEFVMFLSH